MPLCFYIGGLAMQDIIQKIIEIDRMAQKMTDDALVLKDETAASIDSDKKKLREQYVTRARHRITVTSETESSFLQEALADIEKRYSGIADKLSALYEEKHDSWANDLYKRVIGG
jgi:uncharacterized Zn finger protein